MSEVAKYYRQHSLTAPDYTITPSGNGRYLIACEDCEQWLPIPCRGGRTSSAAHQPDTDEDGRLRYEARHPFQTEKEAELYADQVWPVAHGCWPDGTDPAAVPTWDTRVRMFEYDGDNDG